MGSATISKIEYELSLFEYSINFEELLEKILAEDPDNPDNPNNPDNHNKNVSLSEKRISYFDALQYRFKDIYDLDILNFDNGDARLTINQEEKFTIKKYLHKFLLHFDNNGATGVQPEISKLFEKISMNAVKNYLGKNSKGLLTPCKLNKHSLECIAKTLSEQFGTINNLPPHTKDAGVDFIVYKPIDTRKKGNVVILGQATLGRHFHKKKSINITKWQEFIPFAITPIRCLSIVEYLTSEKLKSEQNEFEKAIVFDRGRLIKYYHPDEDKTLNDEITKFITNSINNNEIRELS